MRKITTSSPFAMVTPIQSRHNEPTNTRSGIVDLTQDVKSGFTLVFNYYFPLEMNIAKYAITKLADILPEAKVHNSVKWSDPPSTTSIPTAYDERTKVFNNVMITSDIGMLSGVNFHQPPEFRVELQATTQEKLEELERQYTNCLENSNFYIGNCLKLTRSSIIDFIPTPKKKFEDVIINSDVFEEYKNTSVDFLLTPEMHEVCKKRRIILYGPPGTGKTSLISATFNYLAPRNITCLVISELPNSFSVSELFSFVMKYLTPVFVVIEDLDLIGMDRNIGISPHISQLLALFDGIEEVDKPAVFCSTTNRIEVLDKAITRPCRVDRLFNIAELTEIEMDSLFRRLLNCPIPTKLKGKKLTGSHVQEIADTAKLLSKKNGHDYTHYIEKAVDIVTSHFSIIPNKSNVGFSSNQPDVYLDNGVEEKMPQEVHVEKRNMEAFERE